MRSFSRIVLLFAGYFLSSSPVTWASRWEPTPTQTPAQSSESTKRNFTAALAAYRSQHFQEAQKILLPLARSNPDSFEVNELLGIVLVARGEDAKANPILSKAVRLKPEIAEARTALAANLLRLGRIAQAESQFRKVVELYPKSYDANHNLGEFYIQVGRLSDAIVYLNRAQEIDPNADNNGYDLALAEEKTGKLDDARSELQSLIARNDAAELHSLLGEVEEKAKNYLASASQYQQAARMDPSEQNILDWGTELLLHQAYAPAAEVFKAGLVRFPQSLRQQLGLGIALYGDGHYDDSASAFLHAADMSPADPLPLTFIGKAYDNLSPALAGQVRDRLEAFLKMNATSAVVRYYYALVLWKMNEKEPRPDLAAQVERLLRDVVSLDPSYADAYLELGIVYANQSKFQEAIANYQKAVNLKPDLANAHYRLGQALMRAGDSASARVEFASFERLRETQAREGDQQNSEVQQFVYTMRSSTNTTQRAESSDSAVKADHRR
ncbi:MAG TPA: tetratricopeptide repeat protein [Candidatus Sulfotelmatobacter sp.]|nr:tetratricopeptide repeat protein [Candidatus Sulfotelmatobacter sp.]